MNYKDEKGLVDPGSYNHIAQLLTTQGDTAEALRIYYKVVAADPYNVVALRGLCWLESYHNNFREMLPAIERLDGLNHDVAQEMARAAIGLMHQCDWKHLDRLQSRLSARFTEGRPCIVDTYSQFAFKDDPESHLRMAQCIASSISSHVSMLPRPPSKAANKIDITSRLRIGYISSSFNNHPMSVLMAGVIESHNRKLVECIGYDHSYEDGTDLRRRIERAFDKFVRLGDHGPDECAAKIATDQVDILIDLNGYAFGNRCEILALRPAPIQVNFLGFVGTQGAPWIDYVIADRHVLPLAEQIHWHERIVHMPHSYYPNDRSRPIPKPRFPGGRTEHGLPETGFVYACFNSSYKITSNIFDVWMCLLKEVSTSVLWLYEGNRFVADNLRAAATRAGVDPSRIIFARPMPIEAHIDRHVYADLFLDTAPYGAHTTGADALWAGLPIVTLCGQSFASRVGASLLSTTGLPDLICMSPSEYFDLALILARQPDRLAKLREQLVMARMESPLFDVARFSGNLERVLFSIAGVHS